MVLLLPCLQATRPCTSVPDVPFELTSLGLIPLLVGAIGCGTASATNAGQDASTADLDHQVIDGAPADDADYLGWVTTDGGDVELSCAEIAPLNFATFADVVSSPGGTLTARARVRADHAAPVPLWLWQVTQTLPAPSKSISTTMLDQDDTMVSIPIETSGTYEIVIHTHYPVLAVCGADISFDVK